MKRTCPVCRGRDPEPLFRQQFARIEGATILDGYTVVSCNRCGACYADDTPSQADLDAYYRDFSKYESPQRDGRISDIERIRYEAEADDLARHASPTDSIFEIGCSTAGLLAILKERGFQRVLGLDPSPACREAAKRHHDIDVVTGSLFATVPEAAPFDVVILMDVLEHIVDVDGALARLESLVAPGGMLLLEMPDAHNFPSLADAPFQEFSLEHVNYFSLPTMDALMAANGFAPVFTKQRRRVFRSGGGEPVIAGLYRRTRDGFDASALAFDATTREAVRRYVDASLERERSIHARIAELIGRREPMLVWGTGTHTLRLLATSDFGSLDIAAFVDSNARYHGKLLAGRPILAPRELAGRTEPILIATLGFRDEITRQIRQLGAENEVLLLHPDA